MKRGVKLLLLLGALALCALAGALLARWNAANEAAEQAAAARTSTPLLPIQRGELAAMRYTYAGNTVSLKLERGTWSLADDADFAVDQTAASTMAGALTALSASRAFSGGSDLAQYGLEQPTLTVTAEAADGETHTYALGDMSSVTYEYYLAADGEQTVYLVDAALKNAFSLTRADLAQKDDIPLFTDVRGVATAYPDGRAYTLRYDAE